MFFDMGERAFGEVRNDLRLLRHLALRRICRLRAGDANSQHSAPWLA
jgi:hypothetical protein